MKKSDKQIEEFMRMPQSNEFEGINSTETKVNLALLDTKKLNEEVFLFANQMNAKLIDKQMQTWHGWDRADYNKEQIIKQIENHLQRMKDGSNQSVDIANLCMFWNYKDKNNQ